MAARVKLPQHYTRGAAFVNLKISPDSDSSLHKRKQRDIKPIFFFFFLFHSGETLLTAGVVVSNYQNVTALNHLSLSPSAP